MEGQSESVIAQCFKDNAKLQDAIKVAEFFIKCESCRRIVWLTGLSVFEDLMAKGEFKLPQPGDIIKIIMNNPEIKSLVIPCGQEMIVYYKGMPEQDKVELKNKMSAIVSCIVAKLFEGKITPVDLPIPTDIELPDGFPFPGGDTGEDKTNSEDDIWGKLEKTGTDIYNKTKEELEKRFPTK